MEEKTVWRILAIGLLLSSVAYGQLSAASKDSITTQLKGIVADVDTKASASEDDKAQIAESSLRQMESAVSMLDYKKCVQSCRIYIPAPTTTIADSFCGADRIQCGHSNCCALNEKCNIESGLCEKA